jgi:hypothetical protein
MRRRKFLKFGAGAALAGTAGPPGAPALAAAGTWPTRPVKVVVPFAAGGWHRLDGPPMVREAQPDLRLAIRDRESWRRQRHHRHGGSGPIGD